MLADAASIGLAPGEAIELTPRELAALAEGRARAGLEEWKRALWQAWHAAALARAKRLPDLRRMMRRLDPARPRKAGPERQLAQVEALAAAFGAEPLKTRPKLKRR